MGTEEGKEIYRKRAASIETVDADLTTHRAMDQFLVRGIGKIKCVALWCALAYNLVHFGIAMIA